MTEQTKATVRREFGANAAAYVTSAVKSGPTASASTDPMILGLREAMAAAKGRGAIT